MTRSIFRVPQLLLTAMLAMANRCVLGEAHANYPLSSGDAQVFQIPNLSVGIIGIGRLSNADARAKVADAMQMGGFTYGILDA